MIEQCPYLIIEIIGKVALKYTMRQVQSNLIRESVFGNAHLTKEYLPTRRHKATPKTSLIQSFLSELSFSELEYAGECIAKLICRSFHSFPDEILVQVFSHVNTQSTLWQCFLVCRRWTRVLKENMIWKRICLTNEVVPNRSREYLKGEAKIWNRVFKEHCLTAQRWRVGDCRVLRPRLQMPHPPVNQFNQRNTAGLSITFNDTWVMSISFDVAEQGRLWNMRTGECQVRLRGHSGAISAVHFTSDLIVTGSVDSTLKIWNLDGACLQTREGHRGEITSVQFDTEHIASGSEDSSIRVWRFNEQDTASIELLGHEGPVCCLQLNGDRLISGSVDETVKVWSISREACEQTLRGHKGPIQCLQAHGDIVCSGSQDATIKVWSLESKACVKTLSGHSDTVVCLQFDADKIVSGSSDHSVRVWDFSKGICLYTLTHHSSPIWSLHFSPTELISSSLDESLLICDFSPDSAFVET